MTSKIKVDNVNKVSDDSNIINKCGTTITLGASGDTINLASGASQTGFGRTGTVNWNTTPVTATPTTATSGTGYFMNTSGGAKTINLPGSPSAGDIVSIKDYEGTFATYNCTVGRNGNNIRGATSDFIFSINNSGGTFIYVDATEGWQIYLDGSDNDATETFVTATVSGSCNSIVTCGNYKLAVLQNPGTFTVSQISGDAANNEVDYLVVAGGGGSATGGNCGWGGGGGAGGYRESPGTATCYTASPLGASPATAVTVTAQSYPIDVGGGGAAGGYSPGCKGTPGANSVALGITSTGGGGGSGYADTGLPGGSGGGGGGCGPGRVGGIGNTPPTSPAQGQSGGQGKPTGPESGGGGGGAIGLGVDGGSGPGTSAGCGGAGTNTGILGSSPLAPTIGVSGPAPGRYFGGGGGGGNGRSDLGGNPTAPGGVGGGGTGGSPPSHSGSGPGTNGVATTGGGAGAYGSTTGGSGIVIIRYKFQ